MHCVQAQTFAIFLLIFALSSCVTINNSDGSVEPTKSNSSNPDEISGSPAATQASPTSTALTSSASPTATATTTYTPATPTATPTPEILGTSSVGTYYIMDTGGEGILPRASCEQSGERSFAAAVPEGEKIKLILSGINHGPNLGTDIFCSGTVAAALEGTLEGIPSLAVSIASFQWKEFEFAKEIAAIIADLAQVAVLNIVAGGG